MSEVAAEREQENGTIARHIEISLNTMIDRAGPALADSDRAEAGRMSEAGLDGRIRRLEDRLDELNDAAREAASRELEQERHCTIGDIQHLGRAWVLPHPERRPRPVAPMVRDEEIETHRRRRRHGSYEEARGWQVESVETENRGFDLISRKPHPEDPKTGIEVRFIEVKGTGRRRRGRSDDQRVQDGRAAQERLLALRGLQLRE